MLIQGAVQSPYEHFLMGCAASMQANRWTLTVWYFGSTQFKKTIYDSVAQHGQGIVPSCRSSFALDQNIVKC